MKNKAINWPIQEARWKSVADKLPPVNTTVLGAFFDSQEMIFKMVILVHSETQMKWAESFLNKPDEVLEMEPLWWMHLPEPPI